MKKQRNKVLRVKGLKQAGTKTTYGKFKDLKYEFAL
jgi:hypothetical protein